MPKHDVTSGIRNATFAVLLIFVCCSSGATALAQTSAGAASERTAELKAFRDMLRSADALERLVAFEQGMQSEDPIVRKITLDEGFGSEDQDLRSLALKMWLSTRSGLIVELELPDRATDVQKAAYQKYGPSAQFGSIRPLPNGEIEARGPHGAYLGQFIPGGLHLKSGGCELRLSVVDSDTLSGQFGCSVDGLLPALVKIE